MMLDVIFWGFMVAFAALYTWAMIETWKVQREIKETIERLTVEWVDEDD